MAKTVQKVRLFLLLAILGQMTTQANRVNRQLPGVRADSSINKYYIPSYPEHPNLVPYGSQEGDLTISSNQQANGMTIRLYQYFPFYGAIYNYTMISTNGYIGFAQFSDFAHDLRVGLGTDWPRESDPAVIAPYLCKQRVDINDGRNSKVYYRLEMRSTQSSASQLNRTPCRGKLPYVQCNAQSNLFLDRMQRVLQEGVAGASAFRAEAALVVTWQNLRPNIGSERVYSTYQLIWLTDAPSSLSYTIINYDKLGYEAADLNGNTVTGRCQAIFNGGNHTGTVPVDLSVTTKERPSSLTERSAVPHVVRGRYLHRVDDIVRPVGCSNKTGGTFNMNIYPNIVNMLGETTVEVNGMCLSPTQTYVLMIEQREAAPCDIINPSIARCHLPKILDWGTKTVYFQPQSGIPNDDKAYVGYIYFVPPTVDPMRLDIGNIHDWFHNPVQDDKELVWFPRNFTNLHTDGPLRDINDPALYQMQLGLYVVGYKEARDDAVKKFRPKHQILARLATYTNSGNEEFRWNPQKARINLNQVEHWYLGDRKEDDQELFTYRFGYLKLSPLPTKGAGDLHNMPTGLISAPISIHWLWTLRKNVFAKNDPENIEQKVEYVKKKSMEMCHQWYDEDGALPNFIRDTELNASCPCKEEQAKLDLGRFMPHPRCSQVFRDVMCTETLGSRNCYMSAENIRGATYDSSSPLAHENSYATHYGQVCCYDDEGYLMQTSYQPVIKIDDSTPYSPGFPMRAYEFGTNPYQGMFEIPGFSAFYHDMMPYYLCCKYANFRCQMFYWRRPSSGCQQYEPPAIGTMMGAGLMTTLKKQKFIFNEPGIYNLLSGDNSMFTPGIRIQVRMERFPDRSVDFSAYNQEQYKLVQPSNATVITGLAVECSDSDRILVLLRKDTRRRRYRTTILVNDVIRYFDNMQLQRFKGVTIFVNNVQRGQSEVYVVLNKAQIGIRIRESYGLDMDRIPTYMESFGLLDLLVSVPPQYQQNYPASAQHVHKFRVHGLLNPAGDIESLNEELLSWNDVNNPSFRNALISKYRIKSEAEFSRTSSVLNIATDLAMQDMFETNSESTFSVFPDVNLKKPVYIADPRYKYGSHAFVPQTFQTLENFKKFCKEYYAGDRGVDMQYSAELRRCPSALKIIRSSCSNDVVCFYNGLLLQSEILGDTTKDDFSAFLIERSLATVHYNSCGPISLEYPEFMMKGPSSAAHAYLEGDVASFSCFQDHVSKGDNEYQCSRQTYKNDVNIIVMRWNEGTQPWCRSRQKENFLTWLLWICIFIAVLIILGSVFAACWVLKQRHLAKKTMPNDKLDAYAFDASSTNMELQPLQPRLPPYERRFATHHSASSLNRIDKPPMYRSSSQPFLHEDGVDVQAYSVEPLPPSTSTVPIRRRSFDSYIPHSSVVGLTTGV